jgi:hypothetical protein
MVQFIQNCVYLVNECCRNLLFLSPTLPIGALERRFLGVPALKRESDQRRPMANRL